MVIDMGTYTNVGLVVHCKATLGTNYVYGMKNAVMTLEKYNELFDDWGSNYVWVSDVSKVGTVCVDCSGLISSYTKFTRNSAGYKSSAAVVHDISTIDDAPIGAAVWRSGHIGVYIGDGYIIEARGSAFGCVMTKVSERDFTHWFEIADIIYTEEDEDMTKETFAELFAEMRGDLQDNDCGTWSAEARQWAIDSGMIFGSGETADGQPNYMWADMLTREQMVVLFYRMAQKVGLV